MDGKADGPKGGCSCFFLNACSGHFNNTSWMYCGVVCHNVVVVVALVAFVVVAVIDAVVVVML